ncbi:hypothetical protein Poli38472_004924 [Pythium oligandrum]|uniref:Uncharacterized protein n=1 Tax=Pythium oligandrum TaxID=41045 RepID=A0A8K1CBP1_PYTOL|nr:hypothetical protein Poli38472_004924 [Pythium oligandrum]|eukprot:TMW59855.1 hypothetical protein Poli38472_004924 [Pythium oligandrum]
MLHSQTLVGQQLLHLLQYTASRDIHVKKQLEQAAHPTDEQTRHLEGLVAQAERVFASECFNTKHPSFQDVCVNEDGAKGVVVDTFAGWIVPSSPDKVVSALWSGILHTEPSDMCKSLRMDMEQKDDTLIASYTLSATVPDRTYASSTGTAVSRRYETADGATLIVSMMSGEMLGITPGSQDTITAIELHWMRIRPYKTLVESEAGVLTQVQLNRQIRLTFSADHSPARRNIVNAVIELVLLQVEEDVTHKQEMVEKLMVSERKIQD